MLIRTSYNYLYHTGYDLPEGANEVERKYKDTPASAQANDNSITNTLEYVLLNGTTRGTNQKAQRTGRQIRVRNVYIRGTIEPRTDVSTNSDIIKYTIWLVLDKNTNGTVMTATQFAQRFLEYYNAGADDPSSVFPNMSYSDRFVVLKRQTKTLGPAKAGAGYQVFGTPITDDIDWHLDVDFIVQYDDSNFGDERDIISNALWIVFVGDTNGDNGFKCLWHARIRYEDS